MTAGAMSSYMSFCGNEIVNAARLQAYVNNGLSPYHVKCGGCEGLEDILPCVGTPSQPEPPVGGYNLPELDMAPWYDPAAPESKNFAGLLVTNVQVSSPYTRSTTPNIGIGQTLGRLKLSGRTITVHGWLIGKTCCATQYGLRWLTTALGEPPCSGDCGGCDLDFLECCPSIGTGEDDCLHLSDGSVYVRPNSESEYERAEDFFRRMYGVGVVSGPDVISCRGNTCGCGCSALTEVEFVLASSSPYLNSQGTPIITDLSPEPCDPNEPCNFVWSVGAGECIDEDCAPAPDCKEDPICPLPALPPAPKVPPGTCGCFPQTARRVCGTTTPRKEWGSSTVDIEIHAGSEDLRAAVVRVFQNPTQLDCGDETTFPDCNACSTLIVSFVPKGGIFRFSGSRREVTIECGGQITNAAQNAFNAEGYPFDWPDITCQPICVCVDFACETTAPDAKVSVTRVDRDL